MDSEMGLSAGWRATRNSLAPPWGVGGRRIRDEDIDLDLATFVGETVETIPIYLGTRPSRNPLPSSPFPFLSGLAALLTSSLSRPPGIPLNPVHRRSRW